MTATPARIGFITNEWRTSVATDATAKANYGELARDTGDEVLETFFDDAAAVATMTTERLNLVSPDRRRFRQEVASILTFTGALDFSQTTPGVQVIDEEKAADHLAAIVEIGVDTAANKTIVVSWG